jgi:transposase
MAPQTAHLWAVTEFIPAGVGDSCSTGLLAAADFRDPRIKASREDIIASLRGNWRAELLFQVKQELARYDFCQTQIEECDGELEQQLQSLPELRAGEEKSGTKETQRPPKKRKRRKDGNIPRFDLHHELQRISGVDLTRIDGIDVMTGQTVISEVGLDMSRCRVKIVSHPGSDSAPPTS